MQKAAICLLRKLKYPVKEKKEERKIYHELPSELYASWEDNIHIFGKSLVTKIPCYISLADDFLKFNQIQ